MLLRNLHSVEKDEIGDIFIRDGKLGPLAKSSAECGRVVEFDNAIVFPGIINSHDHLDFNLYPQLGNGRYNSYVEWGNDINKQHKEIIDEIKRVPQHLRVQWGIYKNLLNGVTTVVNHGSELNAGNDIITVFEQCNIIHSVQFQKDWWSKINQLRVKRLPFVIHVGEGTDRSCKREIDRLIRWNLFNRDLVGIHGIAMDERQATHFRGLVWCPASNEFLIGATAQVDKLKYATTMVFGTDSTLSAPWNLWEHVRLARDKQYVTDKELLSMLTINAARLWGLFDCGELKQGCDADLVVARKRKHCTIADSFFSSNPEDILMVVKKGRIRLFDSELLSQLANRQFPLTSFSKVVVNNSCKYVYGNIPELTLQIKKHYPDARLPVEIA